MEHKRDVIVVGASLGGLEALGVITAGLPADLPAAVLAVLHTHASSPRLIADILGRRSTLAVAYAGDGEAVARARVYVAPPDRHLLVEPPGVCRLDEGAKVHWHRPAADRLFESAAQAFGPRVVGVVLTGGDGDGTAGLRAIKAAGGVAVVQDPAEARAPGMPSHAVADDHPDHVVRLGEIASLLARLVGAG